MDYLGVIEKEIGIFGDSIDNLSYHLSLFSITRRCSTLELLECIIFNIIQLFPFTLRKAETLYSTFKQEYYDLGCMKKRKKPLIGFEPMTYALPWRYSTTELKGPFN